MQTIDPELFLENHLEEEQCARKYPRIGTRYQAIIPPLQTFSELKKLGTTAEKEDAGRVSESDLESSR